MEEKKSMSANRSSARGGVGEFSSDSQAGQQRNCELEQKVKMEEKKSMSANQSSAGGGVRGLSPNSQAVQQRNRVLEQKVKEVEEKKSMSVNRALSSASTAWQRRNQEIEQQLNMLDIRRQVGKAPGALSTVRSGGPVDSLLLLRETEMNARLMQLKELLSKAQEVDLAFLVDATYRMQPYIDKVKDIVPEIAVGVKKAFPKMKLRVAFAPYRDYKEQAMNDDEICDFTDSFDGWECTLVDTVSRVKAYGGGDPAKDAFSGLERIASLNWASKTRVLVHIADAPGHGIQFHDFDSNDDHPDGNLYRRDISKLLDVLRHDCHILCYLFCHVNNNTKKMMQMLRQKAPKGRWIQEQKLSNMDKLLDYAINTSCDRISQFIEAANPPKVYKAVPRIVKEGMPNWKTIKVQSATQIRYKFPDTLEELFQILDKNASLEEQNMPHVKVQISTYPFTNSGMLRWPYHALVDGSSYSLREMVVKRFKIPIGEDLNKVHSREAYCQQMEVQTVASQMAEEFNSEVSRISGLDNNYKTVQFTMVSILQVGLTLYNMEKYLEGDWIRYSNNLDYVNTREIPATLHAFSHWTHQRSEGRLMVTDLQGVQTKMWNGRRELWLCDPAVHCRNPFRYARTKTNLSTRACRDSLRPINVTTFVEAFASIQINENHLTGHSNRIERHPYHIRLPSRSRFS